MAPETKCSALGAIRRRGAPVAIATIAPFLWLSLHPAVAWGAARTTHTKMQTTTHAPASPVANAGDPSSSTLERPAKLDAKATRKLAANVANAAPGDTAPIQTLSLPKGDNAISAQAIALPSGPATASGMGESFSAQLTTGIATMSVPFSLPPARGNAQPMLGLAYGSSGGYGVAGVGWSLVGDVFIARQTDRGVPRYDDRADWHPEQDRFVFGTEELVPICTVSGSTCTGALAGEIMPAWASGWQYFRPRVEGAFLRFFWSADHRTWRVQSRDGNLLELGVPLEAASDTGALEANPTRPAEVYRWHLARQYDNHGAVNRIVYRYLHDSGVAYLSDVFDTPPASDPATTDTARFAHHAHLVYDARPDTQGTSFRAGFAQEQRLRLVQIDVTSKSFQGAASPRELVRRYHLDYDASAHASLLVSAQMEGRCAAPVAEASGGQLPPTDCPRLPALTFQYAHVDGPAAPLTDAQGFAFERMNETVQAMPNSPPYSLGDGDTSLMDVNADGLPDVVVTAPAEFGGKDGLYLNGAGGALGFSSVLGMTVSGVSDVDTGVLRLSNPNVTGLDLDGDGLVDLVHMPKVKKYAVFTPEQVAGQWTWAGRNVTTASGLSPKIDFASDATRISVMDVNGDGLVDVVFTSATEIQTFFALGRYPEGDGRFGHAAWTGADTADLSDDPVTACAPWSATPVRFGDEDVRVADMNGDGLPDIVRVRAGQVLYWPGRGNGFWGTGERDDCAAGSFTQDRDVAMANPPNLGVVDPGALELADVNGDGLADMIETRFDGVDVYLNDNGTGWTPRHILANVPYKPNGMNTVRFADVDGSGTPDIVWGNGYDYRYVDLDGGVRPQILVRADNGLGKTTELEYSTSTKLMLDAAKSGAPWSRVMPLTVPVIVRSTVRDNLDKIGRSPGVYVTEYAYRDPVYEGRQREFRGFTAAETRSLGDGSSPTSTTRSTFQLGECRAAQNGLDVCSPADRWRDNWREPLKGLPALVETFDDKGVYLSTAHTTYELRQLYAGRDGRRVSAAFAVGQQSFGYDTAAFVPASVPATLDDVIVNLPDVTETDTLSVTERATGAVEITSHQVIDDFGNPTQATANGTATDEAITTHTTFALPAGDVTGWLFRPVSSYVTGSAHPEHRREVSFDYASDGDLLKSHATLWGTLPLDRFRAGGGAVAPAPTDASAGVDTPADIVTMTYTRDAFGNVVATHAPVDRCRDVDFDSAFAELPVTERVYVGTPGSNGCGTRVLTTEAQYDRGLRQITDLVGITGQPAHLDYDGFGRVVARTLVDPDAPGQLAALPTETYAYALPTDASATPYSRVTFRTQDGTGAGDSQYLEQVSFVDGLGRPLVVLAEADPAAGDGGNWVASGVTDFDAKGAAHRTYQPFFYTGDVAGFPLGTRPSTDFATQTYDPFGRVIDVYGLDGQPKIHTAYHVLSRDVWDAEDMGPGPHQGTYASVTADGHGRTVRTTERIRVSGALEERTLVREYLPTGEVVRLVQQRAGSPDVVRWMRYDSLGRMVLNVEPNTSTGFSPDPGADPASIHAWRYAYDNAGDLVGTSDARGCGVNYHFDAAGRMLAEDYSPCTADQAPYTPVTDLATGVGAEAFYRYDVPDPETSSIADAAGHAFPVDASQLLGRIVSVADRGSKGVIRYDDRGRVTGTAARIAKPGGATPSDPSTYAPRWYIQERSLDDAGRTVDLGTGATVPELLGAAGKSVVTTAYSRRGMVQAIDSSYGPLLASRTYAADGLPTTATLGDAAGTQRAWSYDQLRRLHTVQTYRAAPGLWTSSGYSPATDATQQLSLEDTDFTYDQVGNVTEIHDWRIPDEWPAGAKPVTRTFEYDDLYRLTRARYDYSGGTDPWTDPYAAEDADPARNPQPSPHVKFDKRVLEQRYAYDYLGNTTQSTDDAGGFFDRSLGAIQNGSATAGPNRLLSASDRTTTSTRKGDLATNYDAAGNLTGLVTRRDGPCLPTGASCWQRFAYAWDELGRLVEARRWDLHPGAERNQHSDLDAAPPARPADVELGYVYDAGGQRVLKSAMDHNGAESHTAYIFPTLELRHARWRVTAGVRDYELTSNTENVLLPGGEARGRVVYAQSDVPNATSGRQHVFLEASDYLGSTTFTIDRATGELVENSTYMAYGGAESDYRPGRWDSFREPYRFSGKEEDIEVGLQYFGARYLVVGLGRWASADPATVHSTVGARNPYAYVSGRPTVLVDPDGRFAFLALAIGIAVGALISAYVASSQIQGNAAPWNWRKKFESSDLARIGIAAGIGGLAGGAGGLAGAGAGDLAAGAIAGNGWSPVAAGTVIGATAGGVGGAVGGATSYSLTMLYKYAADERSPQASDLAGLGEATAIGLGEGAVGGAVVGLGVGAVAELGGARTFNAAVSRDVDQRLNHALGQKGHPEIGADVYEHDGRFGTANKWTGNAEDPETAGGMDVAREAPGIPKSEVRGDWHLHPTDTPGKITPSSSTGLDEVSDTNTRQIHTDYYGSGYKSVIVDNQGNLYTYNLSGQTTRIGNYTQFLPQYQSWNRIVSGAAAGGGSPLGGLLAR